MKRMKCYIFLWVKSNTYKSIWNEKVLKTLSNQRLYIIWADMYILIFAERNLHRITMQYTDFLKLPKQCNQEYYHNDICP